MEGITNDDVFEFNILRDDEFIKSFECKVNIINDEEFVIFCRELNDYLPSFLDGTLRLMMIGSYVDDFNTINYMRFNAYLIASVQELHKRLNLLEGKNEFDTPILQPKTALKSRRVKKPLIV